MLRFIHSDCVNSGLSNIDTLCEGHLFKSSDTPESWLVGEDRIHEREHRVHRETGRRRFYSVISVNSVVMLLGCGSALRWRHGRGGMAS